MNTVTNSAQLPPHQQNLRGIVLALYLLFIAGFFTGMLTFVIALIMAHIKKNDAVGTIYRSHIGWFLTMCWVNVGMILVLGPAIVVLFMMLFAKDLGNSALFLLLACGCGALLVMFWTIYRLFKGIWLWSEARAVV